MKNYEDSTYSHDVDIYHIRYFANESEANTAIVEAIDIFEDGYYKKYFDDKGGVYVAFVEATDA